MNGGVRQAMVGRAGAAEFFADGPPAQTQRERPAPRAALACRNSGATAGGEPGLLPPVEQPTAHSGFVQLSLGFAPSVMESIPAAPPAGAIGARADQARAPVAAAGGTKLFAVAQTPADRRTTAIVRPRPLNTPMLVSRAAHGRATVLNELVEAIGQEAALKLVADFGGTRLYVPHQPEADDVLSASIGLAAARRLAQVYGGDRMEVPNPTARRIQIVELRAGGVSVDAIARELGCTRRRVFQVLAEERAARAASSRAVSARPAR